MEKFNIYAVYLDDGENVYKVFEPARNEEEVIEIVSGNGEIISIKKIESNEKYGKINLVKLQALLDASDCFDFNERMILYRLIENSRIND